MILIIMKVFTRYDSFLLISSLFRFSTAIRLLKNERPNLEASCIYYYPGSIFSEIGAFIIHSEN